MQLKLDMSCDLLNVYTKFQIDISKHVEKTSGKRGRTLPRHNTSRFLNGRIKRDNCLNTCYLPILYCWHMGCRCRVTWLCCQLIARPGSRTTMPLWPDPYHLVTKSPQTSQISILIDNCYLLLLKYHHVLKTWNLHYVYNTIVKFNIVVICIVCTHVHWTIKNYQKKKIEIGKFIYTFYQIHIIWYVPVYQEVSVNNLVPLHSHFAKTQSWPFLNI